MHFEAAVADDVEQTAAGAMFGQHALQQFFAPKPRDLDLEIGMFDLKSIGQELALSRRHSAVKTHGTFFTGGLEILFISAVEGACESRNE